MSNALLQWTLGAARAATDVESLLTSFGELLSARGVPLHRMVLPLPTNHPLVRVAGWHWSKSSSGTRTGTFALTDEDPMRSAAYLRSPFPLVVEGGHERVRRRLLAAECPMDFGILPELRAAGVTDYLVLGGDLRPGERVPMTFASRDPAGFSDDDVAFIASAFPAFLLHADLRTTANLATTVCDTYLGRRTGSRVLAGSMRRGSVQRLEAVVGFCDLRGFTATSALHTPEEVTGLLNRWFDAIGTQVDRTGGEILKFIGDAALVLWPVENDPRAACARALDAATALDATLPSDLRGGFSLHRGEVAYGNIGAATRLDFTVIGSTVNVASRLEGLCARLASPWVVSDAVRSQVDAPLSDLGMHLLKGVAEPVRVWGPPRT